MFGGIESSLKHLYVHPGMKWDAREKQRDFRHKLQRFLIVHDGESDMDVAFVSFRWDIEEGVVVMYVYELFVEQSHRGLGIARKLMSRAEELCLLVDVEKIMLTVFESNTSAMHLYREKLRYAYTYTHTHTNFHLISTQCN